MERNDLNAVFYSKDGTKKATVGKSEKIINGVYRCPLLTPKCCATLIDEVENAAELHPNLTLDRTGIDLFSLNLAPLITNIIHDSLHILKDINEFNLNCCNPKLNPVSAYIIAYRSGKSTSHPIHADDSDITLNINLGKTYEGGDLFFLNPDSKEIEAHEPHSIGKAIIHSGDKPHGAKPITSGERYNLIIWLKKVYSFEKFSDLSPEIKQYALNFLTVNELCAFSQTCKEFKNIVYTTNSLWSKFLSSEDEDSDDGKIKNKNRSAVISLYNRPMPKNALHEVLKEIVQTEKTYFNSIKHALEYGITPLYKENPKLPSLPVILMSLHHIVEGHERIIKDLEDYIHLNSHHNDNLNAVALVNIYSTLIDRLTWYKRYCVEYDSLATVLHNHQHDDKVKKFLQEFKHLPASKDLDLISFLIMPVRRVPRYTLLFQELKKKSGELSNAEDVKKMSDELISQSQALGNSINEAVQQREHNLQNGQNNEEEIDGTEHHHRRCVIS